MPIIRANGMDFHYLQAGSGPNLIMLHGLSGNLAVWHLRIVSLLQDRFRVTTYDLRGHGFSSMPPTGYTTRDMADDLNAFMDALDIPEAELLGHSYGADVALHFSLVYPGRVGRLVLIEPGLPALVKDRQGRDWDGWKFWAETLEHLSGEPVPLERRNDMAYMLRRSIELPIVYGPARGLTRRRDRALRLMETTTITADYAVVGELTLENAAKIPHPKLLMYDGGSAWITTFKVLKDVLTNCTPVVLPASELRHFAPLDAPELLVAHLQAFLGASTVVQPEPSTQPASPGAAA